MTDEKHPLGNQTLIPGSKESRAAAAGVRDQLAQQNVRTEAGKPGDPWPMTIDESGFPVYAGESLAPAPDIKKVTTPEGRQQFRIVRPPVGESKKP